MLDRAMLPSTMDIVSRYGYSVNKAGYMKCPFHPDKTASLKIYPGSRGWHCFGCQSGGSTIDFIMKIENCNFKFALDRLNVQCEFKPKSPKILKLIEKIQAIRERIQHDKDIEFRHLWLQHKKLRTIPPTEEFWDNLSSLLETEDFKYYGI
jgi:DNA primase